VQETKVSAFVVAREWRLDDLVRFCTSAKEFSILTINPTFNLGEFNVTPTSYRHGFLQSVCTGKSPVFISLDSSYFCAHISLASPRLTRVFGTDGEKVLMDALLLEFSYAFQTD